MPKTKTKQTMVVFTSEEVFNALRQTYPEAGLPAEYDVTEGGEDATEMAALANTDVDVPSDFGDMDESDGLLFMADSGIIVRFTPNRKKEKM